MKNKIIHISDLHISLQSKLEGDRINTDTFLQIPNKKEDAKNFIDIFINYILEECDIKNETLYLLITGDITDCGAKLEFQYALEFFRDIISRLRIDTNNILLIPGDHDIDKKELENLTYSKETVTLEEKNIAKFKNFKEFYFELLGREFDPNKIIFETLKFDDKLILVGINSSYYIDLENKEGQVDIDKLRQEFDLLENDEELKCVVCCHHNITSNHDDRNRGQWDKSNRTRFLSFLTEKKINFIFSGNEHTNSCKTIMECITISDSGTLTNRTYDSAFKIYELKNVANIVLINHIHALQKIGHNDKPYFWQKRINQNALQTPEFEIHIKFPPILEEDSSLIPEVLTENEVETITDEASNIKYVTLEKYDNKTISDYLYVSVQRLNLFHSGHFHWSETSRAHNWIDTSKLIESKENLDFVKNAVIDVIEQKEIQNKVHLIIGLGYEGNIISTKAAIKFNLPYTFLPYSYREEEHNNFENELNFVNPNGEFQNVLIITDVVNDGRTIRKLVKNHWAFFEKVMNVYVISLFYTGHLELNSNILNYDIVSKQNGFDPSNDEMINNITFYSVKSLKVEKCPYGKDFRESCLIVKDKLGCVNLFYDETKYLKDL